MQRKKYGVLKAKPIGVMVSRDTSHLEIHGVNEDKHYRIALNVKSETVPPELRYILFEDFKHPITSKLEVMANGFTEVPNEPGSGALDYIRGNLFDYHDMKIANHIVGPANELSETIKIFINKAIRTRDASIYAFGRYWEGEPRKDAFFGFKPGAGVHDIHMNQGNSGKWIEDDGVWQDGGLFIHFPSEDRWVAVFLAFQSQIFHTDDITGRPIMDTSSLQENIVIIVAALLDPISGYRTITLKNTSLHHVDLTGWSIADSMMNRYELHGKIKKNALLSVDIKDNNLIFPKAGGIITLLDKNILKVSGVTYTVEDYKGKGRNIEF